MSLDVYKKILLEDNSILEAYDGSQYETEDLFDLSYVPRENFSRIIRSPMMKRYTKVYLLHPDETINKEITEYVASTGAIEKNEQEGQRRSSSLTFINPLVYKEIIDEYENYGKMGTQLKSLWNPMSFNDDFHTTVKIKLISCVDFYNEHYEIDEGIFVTHDPKISENGANQTLSLQLYDKFALLDGTIDGKGELDYEVPVNTLLYDALKQLLRLPKNKRGEPFDIKDIVFPVRYMQERLAYTIKKTSENSIGDLIKEIARSIACNVGYNVNGNLEIADVMADLDYHNRSVAWEYEDESNEYQNPSLDLKHSQIKNRVIVVGANVNGYLCKGIAENTNLTSLYNIYSDFGIKSVKITDNLIPTPKMCEERARYELKKYTQNYISISFQSIWIPFLEPGDIVRWTKQEWGIENREFIVNSISLPLNGKDPMSISITNLDEISR